MKNLKVKQIIEATKGELIIGNEEQECSNFSKDTRIIKEGDTYIAIKGDSFDGNLFWRDAFNNGASCAIVSNIEITEEEKEKYKNKSIIKVKDTMEALYEIAKAKRKMYNIPIIAITGSVGKTSTKDIVASVVSKKYKTLKTLGNNNNNIGLPFTILRLKDEEAMVLEMGMNHFGEISLLTKVAKPDICIITNIGTSHIGNLGSRENILKAKLEILEGCKNPKIIINNDNDLLNRWAKENKENYEIYTYGIKEKSDLNAYDIELSEEKSSFMCNIDSEQTKINVPVGGEHFILNALCAVSCGKILDIEKDKIVKGIEEFELTKRRMDIKNINGIKVINDAYNASLESMKASISYLASLEGTRKIAVLGDMFELGEYSDKLHKEVGKEVAKNKIDLLFCAGKYSKNIVNEAIESGMNENNVYYMENKENLLEKLETIIKKGDTILVKASNGMKFYDLAEKIH